jgi:hypothetical protein
MVGQLGCPGRRIGQSHRTFRLSPRGISLQLRDKKGRTPVVVYFVSNQFGLLPLDVDGVADRPSQSTYHPNDRLGL